MCNGEIIPRAPRVETLIELSHRASSGMAFALTAVLLVASLRTYPKGHVVRRGAWTAMILMTSEAAVGAGLVLFELVAHDASMTRAVSVSVHLVNTFLLLAATALTAWWASGGGTPTRARGAVAWALGVPLAGLLVVGASGAVTALGDTLFPSSSLAAGLRDDFSPTAHVFLRLRAIHPLLATLMAGATIVCAGIVRSLRPGPAVRAWSLTATALVGAQVAAGVVAILTRAPVGIQLVHLLLADGVWIALVVTAGAALAEGTPRGSSAPSPSGAASNADSSAPSHAPSA
jgi:heme A synthase